MNDALETPFCPLPFLQLELRADGTAAPCCYLPTTKVGDLRKQTLAEVWNGEKMRSLRREFLAGDPRTCRRQLRHLECHRQYDALRPLVDRTEIQGTYPRRLDVRLNGSCNLECVMCDVWKEPAGIYDRTTFWREGPEGLFRSLLEIDVLGGEPFIQRDTFRLLEEVSAHNRHCTWGFVTNAQWRWTPGIRARLDKIRIRYVQVSLDSLRPEVYGVIRRPGKLERALETLEEWRNYRRENPFELRISICVQRENWREIPDFIEFAREREMGLEFQYCYFPPQVSLEGLSETERAEILDFVRRCGGADPRLQPVEIPLYESIAKRRFRRGN